MNDAFRTGRVRGWFMLASLVMLSAAGCAGKTPHALSSLHREAIRHTQRGIRAEAKGDRSQALAEFSEALRVSSSIENSEGIVVALVNSSRVHRQNGDAKAALAMVARAIPHASADAALYAEVAFEMAQVKLLAGNLDDASGWAANAAAAGQGPKRGMMVNLQARVYFLKGIHAEAEVKAKEALILNRENGLRGEEANSLRILGDIQAAGKRLAEAADSYEAALAIDKAVGRSGKIAADLRALALLSLSRGNSDQALGFYKRAFAVSSSGGDRQGAAEDLLNLSRIHEKRGEKELSERLLAERDALLKSLRAP